MPGLNRVEIIGYLGKDPETRFTPNGAKVCKFSVGVTRHWKSASGENREETDWFNIEAWGRTAEISQQYLVKGSLVYIEGRLHTDRYEHEGETRYYTKVVAQGMQLLDRKTTTPEEEPAPEEPPEDYPF